MADLSETPFFQPSSFLFLLPLPWFLLRHSKGWLMLEGFTFPLSVSLIWFSFQCSFFKKNACSSFDLQTCRRQIGKLRHREMNGAESVLACKAAAEPGRKPISPDSLSCAQMLDMDAISFLAKLINPCMCSTWCISYSFSACEEPHIAFCSALDFRIWLTFCIFGCLMLTHPRACLYCTFKPNSVE